MSDDVRERVAREIADWLDCACWYDLSHDPEYPNDAKPCANCFHKADRILALLDREGEPVAWRYKWDDEDRWHLAERIEVVPIAIRYNMRTMEPDLSGRMEALVPVGTDSRARPTGDETEGGL